jgi:hypothetical protein
MSGTGTGDGYHHIFDKAAPEEQGSFCTTGTQGFTGEPGEHVDNMDAFTAEVTSRSAESNGASSIFFDGDDDSGTRYNHVIVEKENNLNEDDDFQQAKHGPGK